MNDNLVQLKKKIGAKWAMFEKLHKIILSANSNVEYRVFPIYVGYYLGDRNIAILYFRGKFVSNDELDIGLGLDKNPKNSRFIDAKYMHYASVNYSIKIKNAKEITKKFISIIKSTANSRK